jgi:Ca2+-binding RTX toxin-like protein
MKRHHLTDLASGLRKRTIMPKLLALGALLGAGALFSAAPAAASTSCSFSSGVATIGLPGHYDSAAIVRNGKGILVNGAACGAATVDSTTQIVVNGAAGTQYVTIDLSGGPFAGASEIEFLLKLSTENDYLTIKGTPGDDTITAGSNGINLNADSSADVFLGSVQYLSLSGLGGNDKLLATGGSGTGLGYVLPVNSYGGDGNDTLKGGFDADYLPGDDGNDTIIGGIGNDTLTGGSGNDTLQGGDDSDKLVGDAGADTLDGGKGDDVFYASSYVDGNDTYIGGDDLNDTVTYGARGTAGLELSLDGVANDGQPGAEIDNIMPDVEIVYGGPGGDVITGSAANNLLDGGLGGDVVKGLGGSDGVNGGSGDNAGDALYGGDGSDTLSGWGGGDDLAGEGGNDTLWPGTGDDVANGGTGNDYIHAEAWVADGTDDVHGGDGYDRAFYDFRTADQAITLDDLANDGTAGEQDDIHKDIEQVNTGSGADTITGSSANNLLDGGAGPDTLNGAGGTDTLNGGDGNDTIVGGAASDTMSGQNGDDQFKAQDGATDSLDGGGGSDTILSKDAVDSIINVP